VALNLVGSKRNDAYEAALAALRKDTQQWWADVLARDPDELPFAESGRRGPVPHGPVTMRGHMARDIAILWAAERLK
jgi:hypothetical protein